MNNLTAGNPKITAKTAMAGSKECCPNPIITKEKEKIMIQYDNRKTNSDKILFMLMKNQHIRDIKVHEQGLDGIIKQLYEEN